MSDGSREAQPASVPKKAKQAGEVRARWAWVEPAVWTERMLTALEQGVKGGTWFSVIDKVYALPTLRRAFALVKANRGAAGVDRQTIAMFENRLEENLVRLSCGLHAGTYRPGGLRRVRIDKPGSSEKRSLGIPTVKDRVVQAALKMVLEPIFERDFAEESYGFRPRRGCKDALRRVAGLLKDGYTWVVDADLKQYFDTIPHERLARSIGEKVSDSRVNTLIEAMMRQRVIEEMTNWTPERGAPQGAVLSPLLSNIYLDPLDHLMAGGTAVMVRYADDFVILCRSAAEAWCALAVVQNWTTAHGLTLHPQKTRVVDATQPGGFDFLGYHFERGSRWPRTTSMKKLKDTIRRKTKRTNGHSMERIVAHVNQTLRGWFAYFQHSHRTTFPPIDQWVRMRLRSILRKRNGGRGRGRGRDHQRWPNAYFAARGLYSTTAAYAAARQSARR